MGLARGLLWAVDMKPEQDTLLLVGGSGGLASRYRDIARTHGFALCHYEQRLSRKRAACKAALIVVIVSMVSHPLREQAQRIATREHTPILYLRSASPSALRQALEAAPHAEVPA